MSDSHNKPTNITRSVFIKDLKKLNETSWSEFYSLYAPLILNFARKRGCSDNASKDILQETVLALVKIMPDFNYDRSKGKFRSLLFKITESKVSNAYHKEKRHTSIPDAENNLFYKKMFENSDNEQVKNLWDRVWERDILAEAVKHIKKRVKPDTFKCFNMVFIENLSAEEVAKKLDINPNLVYQHKFRVFNSIVKEAKKLDGRYGEIASNKKFNDLLTVTLSFPGTDWDTPISKLKKRLGFVAHLLKQLSPINDKGESLILVEKDKPGETYRLEKLSLTAGRSKKNDIVLKDKNISRHHFSLNYNSLGWKITDAGARNGIYVNDYKITERMLCNGDIITAGDKILVFYEH